MLPNESLTEVMAFFELFDLSGPLLTSRRLSVLAADAALRIPIFYTDKMFLSQCWEPEHFTLKVNAERDIELPAELLPIALNNCVINTLYVFGWDHPFNSLACAIRAEAAHFAVTEIVLNSECFAGIEELLGFLAAFRHLKEVQIADPEAKFHRKELRDILRQNGLTLRAMYQKRSSVRKQRIRRLASAVVKRMRQILL